jgi:outer membrane protein assembly factor BamB
MKNTVLVLLIAFLLGCSEKEQPNNLNLNLTTEWKTSLLNGLESFSFSPVLYNDLVIFGSQYARLDRLERPMILAFNKKSGARVWEWKDARSDADHMADGEHQRYSYQNVLVLASGPRVYAINMENGKTLWHTWANNQSGTSNVVGYKNSIYHVRFNLNSEKAELVKADINTGDWQPVFSAQKTGWFASISKPLVHIDKKEKAFLYFCTTFGDAGYRTIEKHIVKYDVEQDKVVFDKILPYQGMGGAYGTVALDDKYLYIGGSDLFFSIDLISGKEVRHYALPKTAYPNAPGQCLVHGNKIYAGTSTPKMICYEVETGNILWQGDDNISTSAASSLILFEDVLYYISASDGKLHGIDANTGKHVFKMDSPDRKARGDGTFQTSITLDKSARKIYIPTYYSALCLNTLTK